MRSLRRSRSSLSSSGVAINSICSSLVAAFVVEFTVSADIVSLLKLNIETDVWCSIKSVNERAKLKGG